MDYYEYTIKGCENQEVWRCVFTLLQAYNDSFSLIYCKLKNHANEPLKMRRIKRMLFPYLIDLRIVSEWPGTQIIKNESQYVYEMGTYRCNIKDIQQWKTFDKMEKVGSLWDWDYPLPMDLCFYKSGRCTFASCTHERWSALYLTDDLESISPNDLESVGAILHMEGKVKESDLFFNPSFHSFRE